MSHDFGGLRAVQNYSLELEPGQIRGLIGPNGAGKTTIFNLITGIYTPTEGDVLLEGKRINGVPAHRIASMGTQPDLPEPAPVAAHDRPRAREHGPVLEDPLRAGRGVLRDRRPRREEAGSGTGRWSCWR
jgi:energy-coupling factor transporter ATP-binding protein EcfA2